MRGSACKAFGCAGRPCQVTWPMSMVMGWENPLQLSHIARFACELNCSISSVRGGSAAKMPVSSVFNQPCSTSLVQLRWCNCVPPSLWPLHLPGETASASWLCRYAGIRVANAQALVATANWLLHRVPSRKGQLHPRSILLYPAFLLVGMLAQSTFFRFGIRVSRQHELTLTLADACARQCQ